MSPPVPPLVVVVEGRRIIRASREHVFAHLARAEHLPRYGAPLWLTGDLEERRGGEPLVTLRGYFAGLPVEAVVRTAARSPHSIDIIQVRGTLRGFSQRFTIEAGDEGTLLGCRVEADPGIPMLSEEAVKHFLVQYVERMLDRVRLAAERRAPSRRPLRAAARADADAAEAGAEIDDVMAADGTVSQPKAELASASDVPPAEAMPASGTAPEKTAAPSGAPSVPSTPAARPSGPQPVRPRPPHRPGFQHPERVQGGAASRGPISPTQAAAPTPGAAASPSAPAPAAGEAAASGQARRRRRRRRRRGRGPGTGGPGRDPRATGPAGGNPPASTGG